MSTKSNPRKDTNQVAFSVVQKAVGEGSLVLGNKKPSKQQKSQKITKKLTDSPQPESNDKG